MKNLSENNLVRFLSIVKKKDGLHAKFKVAGMKGGTTVTASVSVDMAAAEVDPSDTLEKIIETCAKIAVRECDLTKNNLQFEGLQAI
jgi:hypothetical protein